MSLLQQRVLLRDAATLHAFGVRTVCRERTRERALLKKEKKKNKESQERKTSREPLLHCLTALRVVLPGR